MNPDTERELIEIDDDVYRPFFWYNRGYNIPDECRLYDE